MPWTFITILTTPPEKTREVFDGLEQLIREPREGELEGGTVRIAEAFRLFGDQDAILRCEIEDPIRCTDMMNALVNRVYRIRGVQDTQTYLSVPFPTS